MRRWWLYMALAVLAVACKPGTPSDVIQPADMEDILVDYHIGQAMAQLGDANGYERDYDRLLYLDATLAKHGVTRAEFDSSLVYYYTRADRFNAIYKRVAERLSEQALALGASEGEISKYARLDMNGDTANIWNGRESLMLVPTAPYNRYDFTLKADTTFRRGDNFLFNFMSDYIYQSGNKDAVACLVARFDNDSVATRTVHLSVSGLTQLRLDTQRNELVKELRGFIYLHNGEHTPGVRLLFVNHVQLVRFHREAEPEPLPDAEPRDSLATDTVQKPLTADTVTPATGTAKPVGDTLRHKKLQTIKMQ